MNSSNLNLPPADLVDTRSRFLENIAELSQEKILAVDTEANSLYAYQEQVCLIQISSPSRDFILDPLALNDLSPLKEIFHSPSIEKVFHASEYDINILWEDFQIEINNLFDTMIAARLLGRKKLGLDSLLTERFNLSVDKRFQRADWSKRPLPDKMLRYAQIDTHFLIEIRNWLKDQLVKQGRWEIAQEDFQRASRAHLRPRKEKLPPCWRMKEAKKLPPQKAAVLKELSKYRDQIARDKDLPLFKVLGNKTLLALAQACPTSHQEIKKINLSQKKQVLSLEEGVLMAVRRGLSAEPISPPRQPRPDDDYLSRERALKDWRREKAQDVGVNSAVILPRYLLTAVARENPQSLAELGELLQEVPLRYEHYGREILQIIDRA
ncbi:MAG: ribonuclease D [Anaerolineales bacterium]|nr:ribonuclease D [Anaerolineales bacterium]